MSAAARTHWLLALLFLLALLLIGAERLPGTPAQLRVLGFETVLLLAGVSLLLGVVNVLALHLRRIVLGQQDWLLSLLLIAVLIAVAGAGLLTPAGAASPLLEWVFDALIAPGQRALFALLVFFMAAAAFQFLRIGQPGGLWMLAGFLLLLLVPCRVGFQPQVLHLCHRTNSTPHPPTHPPPHPPNHNTHGIPTV